MGSSGDRGDGYEQPWCGQLLACSVSVGGVPRGCVWSPCVGHCCVLCACNPCAGVVWVVCVCVRCGELRSLPWLWKGKEESNEHSHLFLYGHKAPPSWDLCPGGPPFSQPKGISHLEHLSSHPKALGLSRALESGALPWSHCENRVCVCVCVCMCKYMHAHHLPLSTLKSQPGRPRPGATWTCVLGCAEWARACGGCNGPGWASL